MCLYVDDFDTTHLAEGWRTARKEHTCNECSRAIGRRESYYYHDVIDEHTDRAVTWKMCAHCRTLIAITSWLTGCPEAWWWDCVLARDEEMGVVANALADPEHDVTPDVKWRLLRLWASARRGWRGPDSALVPVPSVPEREGAR